MIKYPLAKVVEGQTKIIVPDVEAFRKSPTSFPPSDAPVFYNKKMEINRDFALALLRVYLIKREKKDEVTYCEPMAGSGIRSIRVANELPSLQVLMNDRNPQAVSLIKENIKRLRLKKHTEVFEEDANELMLRFKASGRKIDIIDLDPFGSPSQFTDVTAQTISKNGLLAVTSTDMATMCGVYPKACIRKYASKPIHSFISHELAVRMMLGFIAIALARHGKSMVPIFAHSTEHFIRAYVLAEKGITKAKNAMKHLGFVAHCTNCYSLETANGLINTLTNQCPLCEEKRQIGGPIWLGKMYDKDYVKALEDELIQNSIAYGTTKKMLKIVSLVKEEIEAETSSEKSHFYFDIHRIADKINLPSPKIATVIALLQKGDFIAFRTHFRTNSIKTDAPIEKVVEAVKQASKDK